MTEQNRGHACVVVLGDVGRSPRMQYHALSLAKHGFTVDIIGYKGSEPHEELRNSTSIKFNYMPNVPRFEKYFPRILVYGLKSLWQSIYLFLALMHIAKPNFLFVQNPPSIPTLPITCFACWIRGCKLIIDFHNYGFTILGMSLGRKNVLVRICEWCEKYFGQKADKCLCVTKAMKEDLAKNWNIRATVFYDCPPEIFSPINVAEKHKFFVKLSEKYKSFQASIVDKDQSTRFSKLVGNEPQLLNDRPAFLVSSTSWTEDEDFSILLNALEEYELSAAEDARLPTLVIAITGKGPLKSYYEKIIEGKMFKNVEVFTLWLAAEDYPKILASADLGICLHKSSSGLDLPMKVVDMFGSGLPVCAISYSCINELVKHGVNGLLFSTSHELAEQLQRLLRDFPHGADELQKYRTNSGRTNDETFSWERNWERYVLPIVQELAE